ncbi:hypothetical protein SDC9_139377 [bioreactor metagenome]|uniref:Uncharacterized protein n=1 Tax=bioreactor metagenome TaxID=1076179 RepID=A0A645DV74_9ZZZZ
MSVFLCLRRRPLHRDYHVSQREQAGEVQKVPGGVKGGRLARGEVKFGKAQNVRGTGDLSLLHIDFADARVPGEKHVHLAGQGHALHSKGGFNRLTHKGAGFFVGSARHVGGDGDIMAFSHDRFAFLPALFSRASSSRS